MGARLRRRTDRFALRAARGQVRRGGADAVGAGSEPVRDRKEDWCGAHCQPDH